MFDFIEQGIVSSRDADFAARLADQRTRRADPEQEILLVERQLSTADRRVRKLPARRFWLGERRINRSFPTARKLTEYRQLF